MAALATEQLPTREKAIRRCDIDPRRISSWTPDRRKNSRQRPKYRPDAELPSVDPDRV
jgi:hypothetical protein